MTATDPDSERPAPPPAEYYPPWIESEEDRSRWDLSAAIARQIFEDDGPAAVWMATRAVFASEVSTEEPPPSGRDEQSART